MVLVFCFCFYDLFAFSNFSGGILLVHDVNWCMHACKATSCWFPCNCERLGWCWSMLYSWSFLLSIVLPFSVILWGNVLIQMMTNSIPGQRVSSPTPKSSSSLSFLAWWLFCFLFLGVRLLYISLCIRYIIAPCRDLDSHESGQFSSRRRKDHTTFTLVGLSR